MAEYLVQILDALPHGVYGGGGISGGGGPPATELVIEHNRPVGDHVCNGEEVIVRQTRPAVEDYHGINPPPARGDQEVTVGDSHEDAESGALSSHGNEGLEVHTHRHRIPEEV